MKTIDINPVLENMLTALQPIATQNTIDLKFEKTRAILNVSLTLDDVLTPVIALILKLLYIIPQNRHLTLVALQRLDSDKNSYFLRIEIRTEELFFNPNLVVRAENNRFKIESVGQKQSLIFIEWAIDAVQNEDKKAQFQSITVANDRNIVMMGSNIINDGVVQRLQDYGGSSFIKDKLNGAKTKKETDFLEKILTIIIKNLDNESFVSENLEREMGLSKAQLYRKLKDLTGHSSANYIRIIRLQKAAEYLEATELSISEISNKVGFKDLSYFSSSFMDVFHVSPTEWRKGHRKPVVPLRNVNADETKMKQ